MCIEKNGNKKKFQVIQHLHGIGEVNHVHDDLSHPNSFYGDYPKVSIEDDRINKGWEWRTWSGDGR